MDQTKVYRVFNPKTGKFYGTGLRCENSVGKIYGAKNYATGVMTVKLKNEIRYSRNWTNRPTIESVKKTFFEEHVLLECVIEGKPIDFKLGVE